MAESFMAFFAVSAIVIVTPGPDTALTIRNTLIGGRRGGVCTALGVSFGQAIWAGAASFGIVALIVSSEPLFLAIKYAGAAYLVVLGAQALIGAAWRSARATTPLPPPRLRRLSAKAALVQGLVSDLGNPKMAIFFASLLPQFVPANETSFLAPMSLGLIFCAMTLAWLAAYAAVVAKAGDLLNRGRIRRAIEAVTGAVLIAVGLRIAAEQR
jgi:threonine/homoserine/homoserine lactone efflux protein